MAARGARGAAREATDHRLYGREHAGGAGPHGRRPGAAAARTGWIEGRTIEIEYRWAEGREERYGEIAAEFVRNRVDVIFTHGTQGSIAAKQATSVIPILAAVVGDPVGTGLVASLAQPGGNLTGLSVLSADMAAKRLELLREAVPGMHRVAILVDVGNPVKSRKRIRFRRARAQGLGVVPIEIRRAVTSCLHSTRSRTAPMRSRGRRSADPEQYRSHQHPGGGHAAAHELHQPGVRRARRPAELWTELPGFYRRAGDLLDKILRGSKPATIPVEQPTKFDLIINLTTAKALGITIPPMLLGRADEVIE